MEAAPWPCRGHIRQNESRRDANARDPENRAATVPEVQHLQAGTSLTAREPQVGGPPASMRYCGARDAYGGRAAVAVFGLEVQHENRAIR